MDKEITDIIEFHVPDKIMSFKLKTYKAQVSVGSMSNTLRPAIDVFDTGSGPNFVLVSSKIWQYRSSLECRI